MSLLRSRSVPTLDSAAASSSSTYIQRSVSHENVEDGLAKRRAATQYSHSGQGSYQHTPSTQEDPFNLGGFFPTALSAVASEEEEWRWLRQEEEKQRDQEEDEPASGGRSAIFGQETSDAIRGEDKLGVLSLKEVSLFANFSYDYEQRLLSPYASEEVVDENSLYLALCARREKSLASTGGTAGTAFGELFLAK